MFESNVARLFSICLLQSLFLLSKSQFEYGYKNYTEFHDGNLNILISIPHDGVIKPSTITTRTNKDGKPILSDVSTRRIGTQLRNNLINLFSNGSNGLIKPFMVISNLHRTKLDPNRNIQECCANITEDSYLAYKEYHNFISQKWKLEYLSMYGYKQGLLIDVHLQGHPENWVELGYTISITDLNKLEKPISPGSSSICSITKTSSYSFEDILRGDSSLGAFISRNYPRLKVVPSPGVPAPLNGQYFNGGYTSMTHGSRRCNGIVNAIQIESPASIRRENKIGEYTDALALSIYQYYMKHNFGDKAD